MAINLKKLQYKLNVLNQEIYEKWSYLMFCCSSAVSELDAKIQLTKCFLRTNRIWKENICIGVRCTFCSILFL